ncbi:MAG: 5'-methylthioadenosine/S-adenosylhomocysteine nucleosidase [Acidobacteria bacterium]|nr:5'-methylthioadenosine/S-adenosylhomocysteine nucleosidase [Acidobacteriota bacterium]
MKRRSFAAGLLAPARPLRAVVLISANAEWAPVRAHFPRAVIQRSPFGEYFAEDGLVFFHGGWGKIAAAASAQYVIDRFQPRLVVNLGTCGGMEGAIALGATVLAVKTVVYDIVERMGDAEEAIRDYATVLDVSWLRVPDPMPVVRGTLASADRDLDPNDIADLRRRYGAVAADWESGAIAWTAARNKTRLLILRTVSDMVSVKGGEAYGDPEVFRKRTVGIMERLVQALPAWLEAAGAGR